MIRPPGRTAVRSPGPGPSGPVPGLPAALLLAALAAGTLPAAAQQSDSAAGPEAREGPPRIGAYLHVQQDGAELLVTPDTASSVDEGARLFLRCRGGTRELFVSVAGQDANLGDARNGAAGQFRMDRGPWSDLEQWGANEAGTAAFMNPERIPTFVGRAGDAELAEVRIVNPAGVHRRFAFRTDGLEEGVAELPCMGD